MNDENQFEQYQEPNQSNSSDFYNSTKQKCLPKNFAEDLLNLEMEVEIQNVNIDTVSKLLQLYATAIEYYESIQNERYLIFKNKTQALLLKQSVNNALNVAQKQQQQQKNEIFVTQQQSLLQKQDPSSSNNTVNNNANNNNLNQRRESIRINMIYFNQQDSQANVQKILQEQNQNFEHSKSIISRDIKEQECQIHKKLQQRKQNKKNNVNPYLKQENVDKENQENKEIQENQENKENCDQTTVQFSELYIDENNTQLQ